MKKMKYIGRWYNYDRHEHQPDTILRLTATSDFEALKKVFIKKILPDYDTPTIEEFLKDNKATKLTRKLIEDTFDGIDTGGWDYLKELRNITTGRVVFDMGLDSGEEEDLD